MKKFGLLIIILMAGSFLASAQGVSFYTSTEVVGQSVDGTWSALNHTTEGLPVVNFGTAKNNEVDFEIHEFVPSSASGYSSYLAGAKVTPDLSKIFAKTDLPSGLFQVFGQAAIGESISDSGNKLTGLVGGGIGYRATTTVGFNILDGYCMIKDGQCNPTLSSGIVIYLNQSASKSSLVQKLIRKSQAAKLAAARVQ
jgi:hypothetical protein